MENLSPEELTNLLIDISKGTNTECEDKDDDNYMEVEEFEDSHLTLGYLFNGVLAVEEKEKD